MGKCESCERSAAAPGTCDWCIETGRHELEARIAPPIVVHLLADVRWLDLMARNAPVPPLVGPPVRVPGPGPDGYVDAWPFPSPCFQGATGPYVDPRLLGRCGPTGPTGPR